MKLLFSCMPLGYGVWVIMLLIGCISAEETKEESEEEVPYHQRTSFYVATDGKDSNPGTIKEPWATWQKGFTMAKPGDTIYIRGGIYHAGLLSPYGVYISNKKGSKSKPIHIFNYPSETPVLDCSNIMKSRNDNIGIRLDYCSYFHLKGLTVTGVSQHDYDTGPCGYLLEHGGVFKLENCVAHNVEGAGFQGYAVDSIEVINCDSYDNFDRSTAGYIGGQADGFVFCFASQGSYTYLKGCRAWYNSDDGFDCWENEGVVKFENCWAFNNGRGDGDGGGFKLGKTVLSPMNEPQRVLINCMAFYNKLIGFNQNGGNVSMELYNNIAYKNDESGYSLGEFNIKLWIKNNISFANGEKDYFSGNAENNHNSWNATLQVAVEDNDFVTVDTVGVSGQRKANGDLPDISFLRLVQGSDLVNKGVDVGLDYKGSAPDLGPFEVK